MSAEITTIVEESPPPEKAEPARRSYVNPEVSRLAEAVLAMLAYHDEVCPGCPLRDQLHPLDLLPHIRDIVGPTHESINQRCPEGRL